MELVNLDERTRLAMAAEVVFDAANGMLYISTRLSQRGQADYGSLLRKAIRNHDDSWLAQQLGMAGRLNVTEPRRTSKGGYTTVQVPVTAAITLSEGEFNRFYARGLCLRAVEDGIPELIICRVKPVSRPRQESQAKLGRRIPAQILLNDLRAHPGVDTALGLPAGPNSGLSVRLP